MGVYLSVQIAGFIAGFIANMIIPNESLIRKEVSLFDLILIILLFGVILGELLAKCFVKLYKKSKSIIIYKFKD
jgi:H+/gluconate symporter-like permease